MTNTRGIPNRTPQRSPVRRSPVCKSVYSSFRRKKRTGKAPNMPSMPSNHGVIYDNVKYKGKLPECDSKYVQILDCDTPSIRNWSRREYREWDIMSSAPKESLCNPNAWCEIKARPNLSRTKPLMPCPYETHYNGDCPYHDRSHGEYFYHYTRRCHGRVVRDERQKPVCRWYLSGNENICWEADNPEHCEVFAHKH